VPFKLSTYSPCQMFQPEHLAIFAVIVELVAWTVKTGKDFSFARKYLRKVTSAAELLALLGVKPKHSGYGFGILDLVFHDHFDSPPERHQLQFNGLVLFGLSRSGLEFPG